MDHLSFRRTSCRTWTLCILRLLNLDMVYHPAAWQRCADISFCSEAVGLTASFRSRHSFGCCVNCLHGLSCVVYSLSLLATGSLPSQTHSHPAIGWFSRVRNCGQDRIDGGTKTSPANNAAGKHHTTGMLQLHLVKHHTSGRISFNVLLRSDRRLYRQATRTDVCHHQAYFFWLLLQHTPAYMLPACRRAAVSCLGFLAYLNMCRLNSLCAGLLWFYAGRPSAHSSSAPARRRRKPAAAAAEAGHRQRSAFFSQQTGHCPVVTTGQAC